MIGPGACANRDGSDRGQRGSWLWLAPSDPAPGCDRIGPTAGRGPARAGRSGRRFRDPVQGRTAPAATGPTGRWARRLRSTTRVFLAIVPDAVVLGLISGGTARHADAGIRSNRRRATHRRPGKSARRGHQAPMGIGSTTRRVATCPSYAIGAEPVAGDKDRGPQGIRTRMRPLPRIQRRGQGRPGRRDP